MTQKKPSALPAEAQTSDLASPSLFINRELSWLEFQPPGPRGGPGPFDPGPGKAEVPSIFSSNLDEYFMVRVVRALSRPAGGGLKRPDAAEETNAPEPLTNRGEVFGGWSPNSTRRSGKDCCRTSKPRGSSSHRIEELAAREITAWKNIFDAPVFPLFSRRLPWTRPAVFRTWAISA